MQIWIKCSLPVRWSSFLTPALKVQPVCPLEALEYIYKVRNAAANGHETLDTDSSAVAEEKGDLACERYVLDNDKLQVEVLANLDKVQPAGAVVVVSYPRIEGATGLPARVWAITE